MTRSHKNLPVNPLYVVSLAVTKPLHHVVHTVFSIAEIAFANTMAAINVHRARPDFVLRMVVAGVVRFLVVTRALATSSFVPHMVVGSAAVRRDATSPRSGARHFVHLMVVVDVAMWRAVTSRPSRPRDFASNTGAGKNVRTKVVKRWPEVALRIARLMVAGCDASWMGATVWRLVNYSCAGRMVEAPN